MQQLYLYLIQLASSTFNTWTCPVRRQDACKNVSCTKFDSSFPQLPMHHNHLKTLNFETQLSLDLSCIWDWWKGSEGKEQDADFTHHMMDNISILVPPIIFFRHCCPWHKCAWRQISSRRKVYFHPSISSWKGLKLSSKCASCFSIFFFLIFQISLVLIPFQTMMMNSI